MTATLYECGECGERTNQRRCQDCNRFTQRLGLGGHCPNCDEPILVEELLDNTDQPAPSHTNLLTGSIISLYAGGMTVRDIGHHLARTLGVEVSAETISKITDAVLEEVKA